MPIKNDQGAESLTKPLRAKADVRLLRRAEFAFFALMPLQKSINTAKTGQK
jgi:hypothetical protein